jgi:hypothetical protein
MKRILLVVPTSFFTLYYSQTKLLSWNIENFGQSKSQVEIVDIAQTVRDYDIIAIK